MTSVVADRPVQAVDSGGPRPAPEAEGDMGRTVYRKLARDFDFYCSSITRYLRRTGERDIRESDVVGRFHRQAATTAARAPFEALCGAHSEGRARGDNPLIPSVVEEDAEPREGRRQLPSREEGIVER